MRNSISSTQMEPQKTLLLQPKTQDRTALKAAANVTLKLPPGGATAQQTLKYSPDDRTLRLATKAAVETVWDEPTSVSAQTRKLQSLSKKVDRMQGNFEGVTRMKEEKRQMMDDMHEHTMEKVDETRENMEKLLAEVAQHIKEFSEEWTGQLGEHMDELDTEMRDRLVALNAKYEALEGRARALAVAIEEETQARIRHIEGVLVPAREQVERLEKELATEHAIRANRESELKEHMESCVRMLEESLKTEKKNRIDRHDLAAKDVLGESREAKDVDDRTSNLPRLRRRCAAIGKHDDDLISKFHQYIDNEHKLRVEGQDHIVAQIDGFIKRFQEHVLEEGEMGD